MVNIFANHRPARIINPVGILFGKRVFCMTALHGKRILIVEDDEDIVELLVTVLDEESNNIEVALNGSEALAKIHTDSNYDLIISDFRMPQMDGLSLLNEIKTIRSEERRVGK